MEFRFTFALTGEEVRSLKADTKADLCNHCPEFAAYCGVATEGNPPEENKNKRSRKKTADGGQTILPEMNQPNQMTAIDPQIAGLPGASVPQMQVPYAQQFSPPPQQMPMVTGFPNQVQMPQQQVYTPPEQAQQMPWQQAPQQQPLYPPQQAQVPQQFMPQPQQTAAPAPQVNAQMVMGIMQQVVQDFGPEAVPKLQTIFNTAVQRGVLAKPDLSGVGDQNAPAFVAIVNELSGKRYA